MSRIVLEKPQLCLNDFTLKQNTVAGLLQHQCNMYSMFGQNRFGGQKNQEQPISLIEFNYCIWEFANTQRSNYRFFLHKLIFFLKKK